MSVKECTLPEVRHCFTSDIDFEIGEVYLFHRDDPQCPAEGSLWGVFDRRYGDSIGLESSTVDQRNFRHWHLLDPAYRYCRVSTRAELRDYVANMIFAEAGNAAGWRDCNPLLRRDMRVGEAEAVTGDSLADVPSAVAAGTAGCVMQAKAAVHKGPVMCENRKKTSGQPADELEADGLTTSGSEADKPALREAALQES